MKRRVFIAIPIENEISRQINLFRKKYLNNSNSRWIKKENLHITLIPPWYVEEIELTRLIKLIKLIKGKTKSFNVHFNKVTFGPDPKRPRLIWASGETPLVLIHLKKLLENLLEKEPEKRKFKLHLTIARFNQKDFEKFKNKDLNVEINWRSKVENIALFESKLKRSGAEYSVLTQIKLS